MTSEKALLYVEENDPCDKLKNRLEEYKIEYIELKVSRDTVSFPLPFLITGIGVFTGSEIQAYKENPALMVNQ